MPGPPGGGVTEASAIPERLVVGLVDGRLGSPVSGVLTRLMAWRRNAKMLRPVTATEMPSMLIVAGVNATFPPVSMNDETKKSDVITVGTVTVPEKVVANATRRRMKPR